MLTLSDLQREHEVWLNHNFPKETTHQAFLGMVEEMGEIAHAILKGEQEIRGMSEREAFNAKMDGVGDLVIFLAGFCTRHGLDLQSAVETTWDRVQQRDWVKYPFDGLTR